MTKLVIGEAAPLFQLEDLDGRRVALDDFLGQIVLINFWSAECPWAERADRLLVEWQDRVVIVSIASNANEPPDLLKKTALERDLPLVLPDPAHQVADLYGAETTPHLFLLDAAGILRYQGAVDDVTFRQRSPTRSFIVEAIQALMNGDPIQITETPSYGCTIVRFV